MISFLDWIKENFEVWSVDGEFRMDKTETIPKKVLCMVYQNVFTGEVQRYWEHDRPSQTPHFDFDNVLLVSFNAVAEVGCYLNLHHGLPRNIWDCYVENARLYKPYRTGKGALNLLNTANFYNVKNVMSEEEKKENLNLIINNESYSLDEQKQILNYCQKDVEQTAEVFKAQVQDIQDKCNLKTEQDYYDEIQRIMFRGYAMGCVAKVEKNGIPIDNTLQQEFDYYWPKVKDKLIEKYNKDLDVFDGLRLNQIKFEKLIDKLGLKESWPKLRSGRYSADVKTIDKFIHIPEIQKFSEIKSFLNMTKLTAYTPSEDGRVRTSLMMFGTVTSRATPSTAKYPFNASGWARNFIKPSWGNVLAYCDYKSQEPAIQGYLSGDQNLIEAYRSGDIYLHSAKLCKMAPDNATKKTHPEIRQTFKILFLANSYGAGVPWISSQLKMSLPKAKGLQMMFRSIYKKYINWIESTINGASITGYLSSELGWQRRIKSMFKINKIGQKVNIKRSLLNWPIQTNGAEILRTALIDLTDEHFEVNALIHDALLLSLPYPEHKELLKQVKEIMVQASIKVVGGPIEVDHEIITGNWKQDPSLQKSYDDIMREINNYKQTCSTLHSSMGLDTGYYQTNSTGLSY